MDLGAVLGALEGGELSGEAQKKVEPTPAQNAGGDQVLGSLSENVNPPTGGNLPQGLPANMAGGDLGSLLGALMGGQPPAGGAMEGQDPMSEMLGGLLGSIMGGGAGAAMPDMGSLGNPSSMGGLGGMTGMMGGMNQLIEPLADTVSQKLGIPREVALTAMMIIVPLVVNKLMSSSSGQAGDMQSMLSQGSPLQFTPGEQNEMVNSLSAQTGLDRDTAQRTLTETLQVLGRQ